ncbi:hypothetical protein ACH5RR_015357 [Cinchona calisaya]|uniref:RING-CH-type domain-containing protein n=1 Tax=Cinchona calisaya TaxID=153742 RepID=A0ABD2ZTC0_9GENT
MDKMISADENCSITSKNSRIASDQETRITIREDEKVGDRVGESGDCDEKSKGLMENKGLVDEDLRVEGEKCSCVIDVKCGKLEGESQRLCRICHLSKSEIEKDLMDLMELGCGCRGELGYAHSRCAGAWFKLKGNRICEICGETAKNVTGISDNRFMEEWKEQGLTGSTASSSERRRGCWRGQPLCNFLMACLVIAFVMPWFFRVNMF